MDLNKAMIIGNVTKDPELKTTPNGQSVATFSIATNLVWVDQSGQKQQRPEFHNIVVWRKLAEICGQYLKKGAKIYIEGRIETRDWTPPDGIKRYRTEIVADNMIMLDRAGAPTQNNSGGAQFGPPAPRMPMQNMNNANNANNMNRPSSSMNQGYEPPIISSEDPVQRPFSQETMPQEDEIKLEDIPF
ncbi:MAG: single-stranded DNA-binding protein [Candidatus Falkowbacteria bacterium]|nr:single-stranded DNA-binding protein [Candidatus Falkowbacteria bacterium]